MKIYDALRKPDETYVRWHEPWQGTDRNGMHSDARMTIMCTVTDCLKYARNNPEFKGKSDRFVLEEFMCVHWADLLEKPEVES